jgi:acetyl esterase/lipase
MKSPLFLLLSLTLGLHAQSLSHYSQAPRPDLPQIASKIERAAVTDDALKGISFTITHSKHPTADYSAQAQSIADALTAAGAKVKLQPYNSKAREGFYGYYGQTETEKIDTVRKLISKIMDVKF